MRTQEKEKHISLMHLNTKDIQNLKAYLGIYVNVMRLLRSFFYPLMNNSFLLIGEIDFKDKYGPERSTSALAKVYL